MSAADPDLPEMDLAATHEILSFAGRLTVLARAHDNARHYAAGMPFFPPHVDWLRAADKLATFAFNAGLTNCLPVLDPIVVAAAEALTDLAVRSYLVDDFPGWDQLGVEDLTLIPEDVEEALVRAGLDPLEHTEFSDGLDFTEAEEEPEAVPA